jgi:hypothetical protein
MQIPPRLLHADPRPPPQCDRTKDAVYNGVGYRSIPCIGASRGYFTESILPTLYMTEMPSKIKNKYASVLC